jgi:hypothetical protein
MHPLLISNINKSYKIIIEENPQVPDIFFKKMDLKDLDFVSFSLTKLLAKIAARPIPWFYRDSSKNIRSPQEDFFGLYALRSIYRGIFIGMRFIQAGDLLHKRGFYSSSIISYYTGSYHLLNAFLSLNGHIYIDQVLGPLGITKSDSIISTTYGSLNPDLEVIMAILKKNNEWKFEPRTRNHKTKWKEIEAILIKLDKNILEIFISFFTYVLSCKKDSYSLKELIKNGLQRLIYIRHESVYMGYGYDDYVHDRITNRETDSGYGLDFKSKIYRDFALGLLTYSVDGIVVLKNQISIENWDENKVLLGSGIFTPPFEMENFKINGKHKLGNKIASIYNWIQIN